MADLISSSSRGHYVRLNGSVRDQLTRRPAHAPFGQTRSFEILDVLKLRATYRTE